MFHALELRLSGGGQALISTSRVPVHDAGLHREYFVIPASYVGLHEPI